MGCEFNEGKFWMWVVLLLWGGVFLKLLIFYFIFCIDCKIKLFFIVLVKNVFEIFKIIVIVFNCWWCVRCWNRCCVNIICFDLYIEFGYKKKRKIKLWCDCVKNIFELELINVVLEKYVNCFIYGDILCVIFKY